MYKGYNSIPSRPHCRYDAVLEENEKCKDTVANMQLTLKKRTELTPLNVSLLLCGNREWASRAKKTSKGEQGIQRIVRWMADSTQKLAMIGQ